MICPSCSHLNLPGSDECARCHLDLSSLDLPAAQDRVEASVMSDRVRAINLKQPVSISIHALLGDALQLMADKEIGALLVIDDRQHLAGILTERDYLMKVVGLIADYQRQPLQAIMTPHPETVGADDSVAYALQIMDVGGYRHLPVIDQGRPVGILSVRDVIRHIVRLCKDAV
jgi:CBS domain-containing protein